MKKFEPLTPADVIALLTITTTADTSADKKSATSTAATTPTVTAMSEEMRALERTRVRALLQSAATALGSAIASVVTILNPSLIVLAGGVLNFPGMVAIIRDATESMIPIACRDPLWSKCEMVVFSNSNALVAMGALHAAIAAYRKKDPMHK